MEFLSPEASTLTLDMCKALTLKNNKTLYDSCYSFPTIEKENIDTDYQWTKRDYRLLVQSFYNSYRKHSHLLLLLEVLSTD